MKTADLEVTYYTQWNQVKDSRVVKDKDGNPVMKDGKPVTKEFNTLKPDPKSQKKARIKTYVLDPGDISIIPVTTRTLNEGGIGTNLFPTFWNRGCSLYLGTQEKARLEKLAGKPVQERAARTPAIPAEALAIMAQLSTSQDPKIVAMLAAMRAAGIKV